LSNTEEGLLAMRASSLVFVCSFALASLASPGCTRKASAPAAGKPPVIPVSRPIRRPVIDFVDYTGRLDAIQSLDVRARVTGYLVKMPFKEGTEVKKGELLFEIDPRPYQAQLDAAKAQVSLADANYRLAKAENSRSQAIVRRDAGAISTEELEKYAAQELQAFANLGVAKANLETGTLYLDFTKVTSPIDGIVSRYYYTIGNLVNQDQTLLTTVVSYDPMYAYFDMEERTVLRIRNMINEGKIKVPADRTSIPVYMGLEGEDGYPHQGTLDFVNNTVNPSTGTIAVRAIFANPLPPGGRRLLTPGMFVRIHLPIGSPEPALLVIDRALGSDQGLKFAYILDADNKVRQQRVSTGSLQDDGLRVITKGLGPDSRVVVGALQQVRPGMQVDPEEIAMPSLAESAEDGAPPAKPQAPPTGEKKDGDKEATPPAKPQTPPADEKKDNAKEAAPPAKPQPPPPGQKKTDAKE
jgi:membrane fusion protein, multidrug efflux system